MPKLSVLTPLYKTKPEHLKAMVESVLEQSFQDFEFILLNDSPEETYLREIVESYNDSRIIWLENQKNMGISFSRNRLLEKAVGEYIAVFDHDDVSLPERFEQQAAYLDSHPEVGVVGSGMYKINSRKTLIFSEDNLQIKRDMASYCAMGHTTLMLRKSVLTKHDIKWEHAYSPCEDYMLLARLMDKTMFYNIPEVLVHYRDDSDNTTHKQSAKMRDKGALVKDFIYKEHPFLASLATTGWIYLFGIIPFVRIKITDKRKKMFLFGFIPFLKWKI